MGVTKLSSKQAKGIIAVIAVLGVAVLLPLWVQEAHGISAVKTSFAVIIAYAIINYYMKKRG